MTLDERRRWDGSRGSKSLVDNYQQNRIEVNFDLRNLWQHNMKLAPN